MGGKSTKAPQAKQLGWDMRGFGGTETQRLRDINDFNYYGDANSPGTMERGSYLADLTRGNAAALSNYSQNVIGPNSDISLAAQGLQSLGDQSAAAGNRIYVEGMGLGNRLFNENTAAGNDIYKQGMSLGNNLYTQGMGLGSQVYKQGMGLGRETYSQGLAQGADAMNRTDAFIGSLGGMAGSVSRPSISLGSVQNGTTAAGGNAQDYHNEWKNVYAPAARQQLADAQNFNTAAYRENLATQAMADAGQQFQNAQAQSQRTMGSMGMNLGSGAAAALQQQAMLANAAQRAGAGTGSRWMAEQEGWNRVNTAMNNQAGAHLIGGANDALGVEASVTNANTAAQASLANGWLDSQTALRNAQMSAAASAFNAGLDARSRDYATGTQGLMQGYQTGSQGLMQGYQTGSQNLMQGYQTGSQGRLTGLAQGTDARLQGYQTGSQGLLQGYNQGADAYKNAGSLYNDAGRLSIDAQRVANESANTSLGLYMTPREQYFQNSMAAIQPQMWGLTNHYNAYMGAKAVEAGNAANQAGLAGSVIGAAGSFAGSAAGSAAIAGMFSDRRLKQGIVRVGTYDNGLPQYEFAYKDDPTVRYRGVMADEVEKFMPEAVIIGPDGYQRVNYALLGIEMEKV